MSIFYIMFTSLAVLLYIYAAYTGTIVIKKSVSILPLFDYMPAFLSTITCIVFAFQKGMWGYQFGWTWHSMDDPSIWIVAHICGACVVTHYHKLLLQKTRLKT